MPSITQTLQATIERIARSLGDHISGTVTGGTTTTATMIGEPALLGANQALGAELTLITTAGVVQSPRVTAHSVTTGVATLTVGSGSSVITTPTNGDRYEIHRLNGRGYPRQDYVNAINAAILSMADQEYTDLSNVSLAIERGGASGTGLRYEYPMPTGFNWLWGVDFLNRSPVAAHRTGNLTTFRALGDATARTRLGQGFKVPQQTLVSFIAVYMGTVLSPTGTLTCVVETDTAGVPSTTAVTNGTSATVTGSTLAARPRFVVFSFDPPMLLAAATQYHLTVRRSVAVDATNYYRVGEDGSGRYGDGALSLYDGAWTTVAGSDLIFAVSGPDGEWVQYVKPNWNYVPSSADQLWINRHKLPAEGTPLKLRGGAAIATVSAETDSVPIAADYCEQYAKAWLASGRAGRALSENYAQNMAAQLQELGIVPPRRRSLPANATRIR